MAFDLLALGDTDYMERPFAERRAALEGALASRGPPIHLTPTTTDREVATGWFSQFEGAGLDGLIAKPADGHLRAGQAGHVQDQARAHRGLRGGGLPAAQERARTRSGRCCSACTATRRAGQRRRDRRVPDGDADRAVGRAAPAGHDVRRAPVELGRAAARHRARRAAPSTAGGTSARTCRSSRCARSAWSRSATTTWRARGSGTPRSSSAGARTASRARAPSRSWRSRSASTWRKSWAKSQIVISSGRG